MALRRDSAIAHKHRALIVGVDTSLQAVGEKLVGKPGERGQGPRYLNPVPATTTSMAPLVMVGWEMRMPSTPS
jgi:hypothetical protein